MSRMLLLFALGILLSMPFAVSASAQGPTAGAMHVVEKKVKYTNQVVHVHTTNARVVASWNANGARGKATGTVGCPGQAAGCHTVRLKVKRPKSNPARPTTTTVTFTGSVGASKRVVQKVRITITR